MPRWTIPVIAASWVLLAAAMLLYRYDTEPKYNGRSLAQWIKASSQPSSEREAHEAIVSITTNSFRVLVRWAFANTRPRLELINKLPWSASQNPLLRRFLYRDNELFRAACAMRAFEIAGTNAACAVTALAALITDDNLQLTTEVIQLLSRIGPTALPAIRRAMGSRNPLIRNVAVGSLKRFGTNATEAISDVVRALSDYSINVRQNATNVLETLYPAALTNAPAQ
jgi:hypothetical protein